MMTELENEIIHIKKEMSRLPEGEVVLRGTGDEAYYCRKVKRGDTYDYKFVQPAELDAVREKTVRRGALEKRLTDLLTSTYGADLNLDEELDVFKLDVFTGDELRTLVSSTEKLGKRNQYDDVKNFMYGDSRRTVLLLYGLKGTGVTTLMHQVIADMDGEAFDKAAYIRLCCEDNFFILDHDFKKLSRLGFRYIFVDDVTEMPNFITGADDFPEYYSELGMRIVLGGTNPVSFMYTTYNSLWQLHVSACTTLMTYREAREILGIRNLSEYVVRGGTVMPEVLEGRESLEPCDAGFAKEYVHGALGRTIDFYLENCKFGGDFGWLKKLHDEERLPDAVLEVIEGDVRDFLVNVLKGVSYRQSPGLFKLVASLDDSPRTPTVDDREKSHIETHMYYTDYEVFIDHTNVSEPDKKKRIGLCSQPWLQYSLAVAVLDAEFRRGFFADYRVREQAMDLVCRRMEAEAVMLQTVLAHSKDSVKCLEAQNGQTAMAVVDDDAKTFEIYFLCFGEDPCEDSAISRITETAQKLYGKMSQEYVLYSGETKNADGLNYVNVEEYLMSL